MARRIGIDFDNTLVCYDRLFLQLAQEEGHALPTNLGGKTALRDWLRLQPAGEIAWQRLQAQAYGPRITEASLFEGVEEILSVWHQRGDQLFVVSHKSLYAAQDQEGVNLQQAARNFLEQSGLFERQLLNVEQVYFEQSRQAKVARIAELGCEIFIDDLVETFAEQGFPQGVRQILFGECLSPPDGIECCRSWQEIGRVLE